MNTKIVTSFAAAIFGLVLTAGAQQGSTLVAPKFTLAQAAPGQETTTAAPPAKAIPVPSKAPVAAAPSVAPSQGVVLPKNLEGVVTQEEFQRFIEFNSKLRDNPEIKELNDQIIELMNKVRPLQERLNVLRANAIASNPEAKAIGERINRAMMPAPVKK